MTVLKDYCFEVTTKTATRHLVTLTAEGKPKLAVATPPEFRDGIADVWSPEDLLVAATATCYALTLSAIAERRSLPIEGLSVTGAGHVARRADGVFGFVVVELAVQFTTERGFEAQAEKAARIAERGCIVADALQVPVEVELEIRTKPPALVALPA
jgi:organic hydroperoxide reductase OsmC/OhrA